MLSHPGLKSAPVWSQLWFSSLLVREKWLWSQETREKDGFRVGNKCLHPDDWTKRWTACSAFWGMCGFSWHNLSCNLSQLKGEFVSLHWIYLKDDVTVVHWCHDGWRAYPWLDLSWISGLEWRQLGTVRPPAEGIVTSMSPLMPGSTPLLLVQHEPDIQLPL